MFLIDTFGFIFRAYHARARSAAPAMRTSAGQPTEAVYIFAPCFASSPPLTSPSTSRRFRSEAPTFREREFADYKANRTETPPELIQQIAPIRRLLEALRIPVLEYPGFEPTTSSAPWPAARKPLAWTWPSSPATRTCSSSSTTTSPCSTPPRTTLWYDPPGSRRRWALRPPRWRSAGP